MTEPAVTHDSIAPAMRPRAAGSAGGLDGIPHPNPFVCELRVTSHEISSAIDHVSNVEYVRWLDRAAELHSDSLGYTRRRMLDDGCMWFVARHEIDYLAEVHPGEELLVATWVRDFDRVKSWRDYRITRPADGTEVCRAATLWVYVNLARRRPVRVPAAMVSAFEPLEVRGRRRAEADT